MDIDNKEDKELTSLHEQIKNTCREILSKNQMDTRGINSI